jgi:hypothetical protein
MYQKFDMSTTFCYLTRNPPSLLLPEERCNPQSSVDKKHYHEPKHM